jgi:hypothetical protein
MKTRCLQVVKELGFVHVAEADGCLEFEDDSFRDQDIRPIGSLQESTAVGDSQFDLAFERNSASFKFDAQGLFISAFEETGAQLSVDLLCGADDGVSEGVMVWSRCNRWFVGHIGARQSWLKTKFARPLVFRDAPRSLPPSDPCPSLAPTGTPTPPPAPAPARPTATANTSPRRGPRTAAP